MSIEPIAIQSFNPIPYERFTSMTSHSNGAPKLTPMKCSTCGKKFFLHESPTPPFCSVRCQEIDLGRWLEESIGVPFEGDSGDVPVEYRDEENLRNFEIAFDDEDDDEQEEDDRR